MQSLRASRVGCQRAALPSTWLPRRLLSIRSQRPRCVQRSVAVAAAGQPLSFHIGETTVSFPLTKEQAGKLSESVKSLLETFAAKQKAERPKRWDMMEYRLRGEEAASVGLQNLEVMCNPNAYATAFDAKVLITVSTSAGVKVTTEGRLSNLKQDVDAFLEA